MKEAELIYSYLKHKMGQNLKQGQSCGPTFEMYLKIFLQKLQCSILYGPKHILLHPRY